jgi:hypothetical protein
MDVGDDVLGLAAGLAHELDGLLQRGGDTSGDGDRVASSDSDRAISAVATFSSRYGVRRVPGIGTPPWAIVQASASCEGLTRWRRRWDQARTARGVSGSTAALARKLMGLVRVMSLLRRTIDSRTAER